MPGLDPEKIRQLQALKNKPKKRGGGGRKGKNSLDLSVRTLETWFNPQLRHRFYDDAGDKIICENPNCLDPRDKNKGVMTVEVDGHFMCRHCFLAGYRNEVSQSDQERLAV